MVLNVHVLVVAVAIGLYPAECLLEINSREKDADVLLKPQFIMTSRPSPNRATPRYQI